MKKSKFEADYFGKSIKDCKTFSEKLICKRINYNNGAKKAVGLSLTKAAKKIGISTSYLNQLEIGERKMPNALIVQKIETAYKFEPGEILRLLIEEKMEKQKIRS